MAVAEASELIVPIGGWVLREALRQLKAWEETVPELGDFRLNVNLSGRQLADPRLPATVAKLLRSYDLAPGRLAFELTETALVDEGAEAEAALEQLRAQGVGLALDDFGTGYASLQYVRRFPFDTLKLDRSFVSGRAPEDVALMRAAISMGDALGLTLLAEGIESEADAEELRAMGCRLGQGYHFARPAPAAELRALLWELAPSVDASAAAPPSR
jgi:EAL domain-containing protein (putative c-di-GMP-specific phosphodiesterase class I)